MKNLQFVVTIICCFAMGILFHAYLQKWFIIIIPTQTSNEQTSTVDNVFEQHKIALSFWKHDKWHTEKTTVIWSNDATVNIKTITNNWLMLLEDEKIIESDIQVTSVVISPSKELFLSLNKAPFDQQTATYHKLMIIQGLLKTMHYNKIPVQSVRFLVLHQTLYDDHLNFTISWPITGFPQTL